MGFSRQEYWSGLPFPSPGDLPNSGIEAGSPALQADTLTSEKPGKQGRSFLLLGAKNKVVAKASSFWRLQERTGSLSLCRGILWLVAISSNLCFYCYFAFSSLTSCLTSIRTLHDYNMPTHIIHINLPITKFLIKPTKSLLPHKVTYAQTLGFSGGTSVKEPI